MSRNARGLFRVARCRCLAWPATARSRFARCLFGSGRRFFFGDRRGRCFGRRGDFRHFVDRSRACLLRFLRGRLARCAFLAALRLSAVRFLRFFHGRRDGFRCEGLRFCPGGFWPLENGIVGQRRRRVHCLFFRGTSRAAAALERRAFFVRRFLLATTRLAIATGSAARLVFVARFAHYGVGELGLNDLFHRFTRFTRSGRLGHAVGYQARGAGKSEVHSRRR